VFDRELTASGRALVAACRWALKRNATFVNLSLGTLNRDRESALAEVVAEARECGTILIAAGPEPGKHWLPGALDGVWRVSLDWTLPRDRCRAAVAPDGSVSIAASGYPRPRPGVPPERNIRGLSFAVANATGLLAALLESQPTSGSPHEVLVQAIESGWSG
jgi:hypothetical protein